MTKLIFFIENLKHAQIRFGRRAWRRACPAIADKFSQTLLRRFRKNFFLLFFQLSLIYGEFS
jgi:hypothetical protein